MKRLLLPTLAISALCFAPKAFCQKILTTIPIGGQPGYLAVNTATNMIYMPNQTLNTITVINGNTGVVVANIDAGLGPYAAAANPATNLIYVTNTGGISGQNPSVLVIDGSSNTVIATVPATAPEAIAVNPTTNLIYFANGSGASVSVLDGSTNQIVDTVQTSHCCFINGIAVNSATNRIYIAEAGSSQQVAVIDGATNQFDTFQVPGVCELQYIAVDSTLNRIYVMDGVCGKLYVISGVTNKVVATVLPGYYGPMALNSTNHQIAAFDGYTLSFIGGRTLAITGGSVTFPVGQYPANLAASGNNRYYVAFNKSDGIAVVSGPPPTGKKTGTVARKKP
jgi:DNA-binding beta-propeller fold protein YncE